jgi:hypothetical protein
MSRPFQLNRRLLLKGFAGLGIALPALELTHGKAWAQATPAGAKRFIVFFEHGGTISNVDTDGNLFSGAASKGNVVDAWKPLSDGVVDTSLAGKLGAIHQPLVGHEGSMLVLTGVDNLAAKKQAPYNGGHGWANATVLTNAIAAPNSAEDFWNAQGPSIDAVLAQRLAQRNPVPFSSVNLEVSAHNYGSPFFRGANQPVDSETDPQKAFSSLFASVSADGGQPDPRVLRAKALQKSVLDGTSEGLALYKKKLSTADQLTIDAHLSLIRGIEVQISQMPVPLVGCTKPTLTGPFSNVSYGDTVYNAKIQNVGPAQVDILVAAMACGLTNVGTLNIGDFYNDWMMPTYPAGYNIGHSLHHSANDVCPGGTDAANFSKWYKTILDNRQWRASMFARLLNGLKAIPEGNGTLLDNSLVLWTSEFTYGGQHGVSDLPLVLAGKAGGLLQTGRHVRFARKDAATGDYQTSATLNNLYTSCLRLCGYSDTSFGASFTDYKTYYPGNVVTRAVSGPLPGV